MPCPALDSRLTACSFTADTPEVPSLHVLKSFYASKFKLLSILIRHTKTKQFTLSNFLCILNHTKTVKKKKVKVILDYTHCSITTMPPHVHRMSIFWSCFFPKNL